MIRLTRILLTAIVASSLIGCGGNGLSPSVRQSVHAATGGTYGSPVVMYSRSYLASHPELKPHYPVPGGILSYHGGPVQLAPLVDLIFWGWNGPIDKGHDPDGLAPQLVNYVNALGQSSYFNIITQYYQTAGGGNESIVNPETIFGGAWYDSSQPPHAYAKLDLVNEVIKAINQHFGYDPNANYIVVTPTGVVTNGFPGMFCAYHSVDPESGGPIYYTNFNYIPDAGAACYQGSVNNPGTLDGVTIVAGHEIAEAATDPNDVTDYGWIETPGRNTEIGDLCQGQDLQNDNLHGGTFPNQPLYSDADNGCVHSHGTVHVFGSSTVAVGAGGSVWALGNESGQHTVWFQDSSGHFEEVPGALAVSLAVDPSNAAWVSNSSGAISQYNGSGFTQTFSCCRASSISFGANGAMWVLSTQNEGGQYPIFQCYIDSQSCTQHEPGALAKTISVNGNGNPWVTNINGDLFQWNGSSFVQNAAKGSDVAASLNAIWLLGFGPACGSNGCSASVSTDGGQSFLPASGTFKQIAVGSDGIPWAVDVDNQLFRGSSNNSNNTFTQVDFP